MEWIRPVKRSSPVAGSPPQNQGPSRLLGVCQRVEEPCEDLREKTRSIGFADLFLPLLSVDGILEETDLETK